MHRGMDLMETNLPANLEEAVRCFDEAIALRLTLPLAENSRHRYGLAAGWMNRGDALARLGAPDQLIASVKSYDEALSLLLTLPLQEDPLYPRRLVIAWINRGFARQKEPTPAAQTDAVRCFREALAVLDSSPATAIADRVLLQAGAWTNLAGALLNDSAPQAEEAMKAVRQVLILIKPSEQNDVASAEAGFKARYLLCRAIAMESRDGLTVKPELLATATDAVDESLSLARHWEQLGDDRFREPARDLFRFGCRLYQTGQPRFLAEFLLENLDPKKAAGTLPVDQKTHEAAIAALWTALKEIQRDGFKSLSTPRFEQLLEKLRTLRITEERLTQLRRDASA